MKRFAVDKVTGDLVEVSGKSSYTIDLIESAKAAVIKAAAQSNGVSPARRDQLSSDEEIAKLNRRYSERAMQAEQKAISFGSGEIARDVALYRKPAAERRRSWTAEEIRRGLAVQDEGKTWDADEEDIVYHEPSKTYRVVPRYPGGLQDSWRYQYDDDEVIDSVVVDQVEEPILIKPKGPTKMDPFWIQRGGERIDKTHTGEPIPEELELWYNGDLTVWRWDTDRALDLEPLILANLAVERKNIEEGYNLNNQRALEEVQSEVREELQLQRKLTTGIMLASGVGTAGVALVTQNFMMAPLAFALLSGPSLIRPRK